MAQSFMLFDFGADEESAQQARHKLEGWKQAFRLDRKLMVKFDRGNMMEPDEAQGAKESKKKTTAAGNERIRVLVRLDFSDHEKLSHSRWLERIPTEAPFKDAQPKVVRQGEAEFGDTSKLFDDLT